MRIILFDNPLPYPDECELHGKVTHYVRFVAYNALSHQVHYYFYCGYCLKRDGKESIKKGVMSIKEWAELFTENNTDN